MSVSQSIQDILITAKSGDKSAEGRVFSYLTVRFTLIAKQRISSEDAHDVAQDACLTVMEKYKTIALPDNFESWAYQVLRNKIGNYYQHREIVRRSQTNNNLDFTGASPVSQTVDLDKRRILLNCLKKISKNFTRYARVLNLIQLGYTSDEICERLRLKRGNFYMILSRGRKILTQCLEMEG